MMNFVLHLLWLVSMVLAGDYKCRRLPESVGLNNCINNPRVRIAKTEKSYKLALCANNSTCIPTDYEDWIKCKNVCPVCQSLLGQHGKLASMIENNRYHTPLNSGMHAYYKECSDSNKLGCERKLDQFLDNYCASAIYTSTATTTATTTTTEWRTVITTEWRTSTIATTVEGATITLGAFIGFLILLLALFATGWILTFLKLKRSVPLEHDR